MTSPRIGGSGRLQRRHAWAWLVALAMGFTVAPGRAQSTETAPAAGSDSALSVSADSEPAAPGDSLARAGRDSSALPARPAPPPAPVDSALGAACQQSGGAPPDLLVVTFRPTTTASEREAVAREMGGMLLGTSEHAAPGAWFLRVPGSAGNRSVADRLIQFSPVLEVGTTRCPS